MYRFIRKKGRRLKQTRLNLLNRQKVVVAFDAIGHSLGALA
jgi:hypothetical protein